MMLGSMKYDTRIYGQDSRYTVCVNDDENFNMYEVLNKAIGNIKAQMTDFERVADEAEQTEEVIPADPDVRNYTYTFFEGKLYYRENSEMVRKEVSQTAEERIRSLDEIRQITTYTERVDGGTMMLEAISKWGSLGRPSNMIIDYRKGVASLSFSLSGL